MAERIVTRGMEMAKAQNAADHRQSRRMLFALVVLVFALVITVLRDRDSLFGNDEAVADQNPPVTQAQTAVAPALPATAATEPAPAVPAPAQAVPQVSAPAKTSQAHPVPQVSAVPKNRPVRSYKAEVIHQAPAKTVVSEAAQRAQLSTAPAPAPASGNNYPLLDASTRVQGSVVLQALINAEGMIQDLRVLSGPAILGTAARQAVLQWRFKPYMENGRAVETQATITVNFTIKVADGGTKSARNYTPDRVIVLPDNS